MAFKLDTEDNINIDIDMIKFKTINLQQVYSQIVRK